MQRYISLKGSRIPQKLLKITEKEQSRSAVGAVRSEAGARSGAPESFLERGVERRSEFLAGARSGARSNFCWGANALPKIK